METRVETYGFTKRSDSAGRLIAGDEKPAKGIMHARGGFGFELEFEICWPLANVLGESREDQQKNRMEH